jgi:tRNA(Ile)-lysidine synthase TilS/MesJ
VWHLKKHLILDFALKYHFKRVVFATTGHGIACKMISQLSKGRGATIANEVSYCNETLSSGRVTVCRPMRDFLQKEIALYTYLNKLDIIT